MSHASEIAATLMDALVPPSPVPKLNVIIVDSLPLLSAAILNLSSCNVFSLDLANKNRPTRMDHTELEPAPPSFLLMTGLRMKFLKPGLKSFSEDEIRAVELSPGTVYIFELPKLLQARHGDAISDFLSPILTDPSIIICGVQVVARLRALACEYAHWLPCFYESVWGLQEIGKLKGGSETWSKSSGIRGLRDHFQELDLESELDDGRHTILGNGVCVAILVYKVQRTAPDCRSRPISLWVLQSLQARSGELSW